MRASFRLGSIAGIEIGIHYTWFIAFVLIAWSLAAGVYPALFPDWSQTAYWVSGFVSALLLFISVLVHELAHSFVARARGLPAHSITLFIFGGVSNLEGEPSRAWDEFAISIVGPLTSLILAGVFAGLYYLGVASADSPISGILEYMALINALLAVFNLIPGFPLDGGRVLRSIVWGRTHNLVTATNAAARVGQLFGWGFIGLGVYWVLVGDFLSGLWIAFIGWFLSSTAEGSRRQLVTQEMFKSVKVRTMMDVDPPTIQPGTAVEQLVREYFLMGGLRALPVVYGDRLMGIVSVTDVKKVPQDQWGMTAVTQIMTRTPLYSVSPDDPLTTALQLMSEHDVHQLVVLEGEQLVGLLTRSHIVRYMQSLQELGLPLETGQTTRPRAETRPG